VSFRLRTRIIVPFLIVALAGTAAVGVVAVTAISNTLRARVQARTNSMARVVSRSDFALNVNILKTVKEITGADVLAVAPDGTILATTFASEKQEIADAIARHDRVRAALAAPGGAPVGVELTCGSVPCYVTYQQLSGRPDAIVAVVAELSEVTNATTAITRALALAVIVILLAVFLISQLVTRRVTAPLDQLVTFTRTVSDTPDTTARAGTGTDEVGRLGTAFNEMLDRLRQSREALVRSEKLGLAGLLAARVAHDIRNPLSSMKMEAQLLQRRATDSEDRASLAAILHDITTVEAVVRDLLEVARPDQLRREPTDPNTVIARLLDHLAPQLAHRRIELSTSLRAPATTLPLDAQRFGQALLNIIVNACDAMPGGGRLDVATSQNDGSFHIEIRDDGTGIDPAVADRVFDPFVSTKRDGVGLGLVNAKTVIESHGGTIELEPRSPRGTIARVTLPTSMPTHG
jgi:signal transduction histidine kinase